MPFEVGFRASSNTEGAKGFSVAVARAMARVGARHDRETETVVLSSGEAVHLGLDSGSGLALIVADEFSDALVALCWALADETATIIQSMDVTAATQTAGEPPAVLLHFPQVWRLTTEAELHDALHAAYLHDDAVDTEEAERQAAYDKALAEGRAAQAANRRPVDSSGKPAPSLFQRLSDALFGKAI